MGRRFRRIGNLSGRPAAGATPAWRCDTICLGKEEAKLRLNMDALTVESFEAPNTPPAPTEREIAGSCLDTYCPPRQCGE
jgi:hypothetical protein